MRRISLLTGIFTIAVFVVAAVIIGLLYRTALSQQTQRLEEVAHSQARTIESIARHEAKYSHFTPTESEHGDALASTLAQVRDANERFSGFGLTGEFSLARREGDSIVYLLTQRHPGSTRTMAIPFNGTKGEPMRRALSGLSGTVIGPDYRGVTVLAAYEPVSEFGLGIVAKIDLTEVQAPFVRAGLIGLVLALVTVLLGSLLFYRITNPVLVQLRESAERLRRTNSLLEAVTTGTEVIVAAADTDFRYVFFNQAYQQEIERLGGRGLEVGASIRDVFAHMPALQRAAIENWGRTLKGEVRGTYRMEFGDPGRYQRTYSVRQTLIRDAQGVIVAAGEVASDITEQVMTEEALSRNEATLRGILDATRESVWLFSTEGVVLQANAMALTRFGKTGPEVVGKSMEEILSPELARLRRNRLQEVVELARPVEFEDERAGIQFRHSFYPVLDAEGRAVAVASFSRDITERKLHESRIIRLTRLYSVLSTVSEAIVRAGDEAALLDRICTIVSEDGGFPLVWVGRVEGQEVRPASVCGPEADYLKEIRVEVAGALGSGPTGTCIREDRPMVNDDFDTNAAAAPWREPARRHGFRASVALPLHRGGEAVGALTIYAREPGAFDAEQLKLLESLCADVSYAFDALDAERRRRQTEEALRETMEDLKRSNEELEQFAYVASHDLQQPLRMVASYVELLGQRYKGRLDEKADKYIAYASGGAIRMHQLVNDLLAFSRVGAKAAPFAPVGLDRVVAQARENLTVAIEQSRAVIEVTPLPVVSGDEIQLVQLFQNLLDNAVKFRGPTPPVVWVSCRDAGTEWEFAVRDNGIGIDPKYAGRIFGVFKRLHTEQEYPGTGIGLALCRKIIERHGGRIHVEPAEGGGSVFRFTLPKRPAAKVDEPAGLQSEEES